MHRTSLPHGLWSQVRWHDSAEPMLCRYGYKSMFDVKGIGHSEIVRRSTIVATSTACVGVKLWFAPTDMSPEVAQKELEIAKQLVKWADCTYGRSVSHQAFSVLVTRVFGNPQHLTGKAVCVASVVKFKLLNFALSASYVNFRVVCELLCFSVSARVD